MSSHSGGLVIIWNDEAFKVSNRYKGTTWIILEGVLIRENWEGCIGLVYPSYDEGERTLMYEEITNSLQSLNRPCMLMGDFNEVVNIENRRGQTRITNSMIQFKDFIDYNQFRPLELFRRRYT